MTTPELSSRAGNACELCKATHSLVAYRVCDALGDDTANSILCCETCESQITGGEPLNPDHWRCLNESMWSTEPAVQIMAWRMLSRLAPDEAWARDALEKLYLEEDILALAQAGASLNSGDVDGHSDVKHVDSNGNILQAGDTVVLIKDLNVKGASFVAKRGTAVRRISLVPDNAEHIEGRVNDQQIVILTKFVKKA